MTGEGAHQSVLWLTAESPERDSERREHGTPLPLIDPGYLSDGPLPWRLDGKRPRATTR